MGFLHKNLTLKEKEQIGEDVKKIIDSFGKVLSSFGDLPIEGAIERKETFRSETLEFPCDVEFRSRILENAPNKNKDFILAEKKKW